MEEMEVQMENWPQQKNTYSLLWEGRRKKLKRMQVKFEGGSRKLRELKPDSLNFFSK